MIVELFVEKAVMVDLLGLSLLLRAHVRFHHLKEEDVVGGLETV